MSTIKTTYLQHPSSGSPNLTLAADGSVSGGAGLGGLVLVGSSTFSAASSVSLDNVFSSTYRNYRLILDTEMSANTNLWLRWRSAGADNTGSVYTYQDFTANGASVSASQATEAAARLGFGDYQALSADIYSPNIATQTRFMSNVVRGATSQLIMQYSSWHNVAASYDGFTLYPNTGTFTGVLRLYGYADA